MSVESMAIALHHSKATGAARSILIGIANHDGDGGAWPSMATLAKYGNVNLRNARSAVERLEQLGEIKRLVQRGGTGDIEDYRRPNLYKFLLTCPHDCDRTKNHRTRDSHSIAVLDSYPQGGSLATGEVAGDRGRGSLATSKPSTNHLTTDSEINLLSDRARASVPNCPTTGQEHRINRKLGYCADCLEPIATLTSPNRKEGDS